jgi:hypothetical protein
MKSERRRGRGLDALERFVSGVRLQTTWIAKKQKAESRRGKRGLARGLVMVLIAKGKTRRAAIEARAEFF